jgi:hypothetical protein
MSGVCVCMCTRVWCSAAGAAVIGGVAPASAQPIAGGKKATPKRVGSDRMPAKNFAPVVSSLIVAPSVEFAPSRQESQADSGYECALEVF